MSFDRLIRRTVGLVLCISAACANAQNDRQNVLLILIDDLKPAIGAFGDPLAKTPNLDRLAESGVIFDRAYCNQAVCAPSRIHLLTGMRSTTSGIYGLNTDLRESHSEVVTLPEYFKNQGYHASSIGKVFHVGHGSVDDAQSWSELSWHESPIDYALTESTGGQLTREEALFANWSEGNPWELPRGAAWERAEVEDDVYAEGRIAREAIRRLQRHARADQPFFLAVGFTKPHLPFCAPEKYWAMYDPAAFELAERHTPPTRAPRFAGKNNRGEMGAYTPVPSGTDRLDDDLARTLIHGYYASVSYMDAQLGLVLDELEAQGLDDNTIVALWGDHGFHLGDLGLWTKHTNFEEATRIPIIVAGPGIEPGWSASFAETVDLYPTLIELAGVEGAAITQRIDGLSLVPTLADPGVRVRDHAIHCFPRGGYLGNAIRTARHRLVEWRPRNEPSGEPIYELYDFDSAAGETVNVAAERPGVVVELRKRLHQELNLHMGKPLFADPHYHGSCDPEIVWNPGAEEWLIFYTGRRALAEDGNTPAGTPIGVAASTDWRTWEFRGYCAFDGTDNTPDAERTYWAPAVVVDGHQLRMYVTYKPQATGFWGGTGEGIRHYVADASDPLTWTLVDLSITGEDAIDAGLLRLGDEWQMVYRDKPDAPGETSFLATSRDLVSWQQRGPVAGDINNMSVTGHKYQEAQYAFAWNDAYWLLTDPSGPGLAAYRSRDGRTWEFLNDFMVEPGTHPTDTNGARHPSVAVIDGRAFMFYHVEPDRPEGPYSKVLIEQRRTFLQIAELEFDGRRLTADRNKDAELPSRERLRKGPDQ